MTYQELKDRANRIEVKRTNYITKEDGIRQVRVYADGSYKTYNITEGKPPMQIDEGKKELSLSDLQDAYGNNLKIEEQAIKTGIQDKINAKYDAELAALEQTTSKKELIDKYIKAIAEQADIKTVC
jgi:hypothetical protein